MRLNLSDAVEDLAPITPPSCFHSRIAWLLYLKSAAAAQNSRQNQKAIVIGADGQLRFNDRLNYCADCTQAKSMEMLALGRCDPYHLSDQPDPPDTTDAPAVRSCGEVINMAQDDTAADLMFMEAPLTGDAFTRLVAHLLALDAVPTEQEKRPVVRVSGQRRALVAG